MTGRVRPPVAAVDIGSLSTGLLIVDGDVRLRRSVDTHMGGAALGTNGVLSPQAISSNAIDRLGEALSGFAADIPSGAEVRAVATAGARSATNTEVLTDLVGRTLGVAPTIVDGATEARLAFHGAVSDSAILPADPGEWVVTIDLGGASTEIAIGTSGSGRSGPAASVSLPIGGSLLGGAYFESDPPLAEELSAALSIVELHITDAVREMPQLRQALTTATVIGLGGISTLAAVEIGLNVLDPENGTGDGPLHGVELTHDAVEDVFRTIATENRADRAHNPGLPLSRVDDVVGGCALLVEAMRQLAIDSLIVSQRGLLDGVAGEMLQAGS